MKPRKPKSRMELVLVTPEMALEWICDDVNYKNRLLRPNRVEIYSRDMKSGNWNSDAADPISFARSARLLNGQHRLHAVVESGCSVWFWIQFDTPEDAQYQMDNGLARRVEDFSDGITKGHVSVARCMLRGVAPKIRVMSRQEIRDYINLHKEAIDFALEPRYVKRVTVAPVRATIARAWYTADHGELRAFGRVLVDGWGDQSHHRTVITLRNHLMAIEGGGGAIQRDQYLKSQVAVQAYLDKRKITKLYAKDYELFPIPGDEG